MTGPVLAEWEQIASTFGVAMEQVRRDHLISHVPAAISTGVSSDHLVFFVGTALSRTHLADARLSEDIDLIAQGARGQVAEQIERAVRRGIARSHGRPTWQPTLTATTGSQPAVFCPSPTARASRCSFSVVMVTRGRPRSWTLSSATRTHRRPGFGS